MEQDHLNKIHKLQGIKKMTNISYYFKSFGFGFGVSLAVFGVVFLINGIPEKTHLDQLREYYAEVKNRVEN